MTRNPETRTRIVWSLAGLLIVASAGLVAHAAKGDAYQRGTDALDQRQWNQAVAAFDEVIGQAADRVDGALYWKAYALSKAGRIDAASQALNGLLRDHPDSRWVKDGKALQLELRRHGAPVAAALDENDLELKLIALQSLAMTDPERALPILEKLLLENGATQPSELREQALFVLIQTGLPEAMRVTAQIARDGSDPELQQTAIHHLGLFDSTESLALLEQLFGETDNEEIKLEILHSFMLAGEKQRVLSAAHQAQSAVLREEAIQLLGVMHATAELEQLYKQEDSVVRGAILRSFMIAGERGPVLAAARGESSSELRAEALQLLGVMGATDELSQLYAAESSEDVKLEILQAFMIGGDRQRVLEAAQNEPSQELRERAIQLLGLMDAGDVLWELYQTENSTEVKQSIIEAMFLSNQTGRLEQLAREEPDAGLRASAIHSLGLVGGSEAARALRAIYAGETDRAVREAVLQALFVQGNVEALLEIARTETDPELRQEAVRHLSHTDSEAATAFMLEILEE
jgi:HEAT repeat protein